MSSQADTSHDAGRLAVRDLMKRAYVAAPCPVKWEDMTGDEKRRLCAQCDCYVLKAAEMTDEEVIEAITRAASGQRVCMQFYKRADGTILTKNCPVGLALVRERASRFASRAASAVVLLLSSVIGVARADDGSFLDGTSIGDETVTSATNDLNTASSTTTKQHWRGSVKDSSAVGPQTNPTAAAATPAHKVVHPMQHYNGYISFSEAPKDIIDRQKEAVKTAQKKYGAGSLQLARALSGLSRQLSSRHEYDQALPCSLEALHIFETHKSWDEASRAAYWLMEIYKVWDETGTVDYYADLGATYKSRYQATEAIEHPVPAKPGNKQIIRTYDELY